MTSPHRFPDLTGKAVIAVGDSALLAEITRHLASNSMLIAVVAPDRELVRQAVEVAEGLGAVVNGFTVDPADAAVWERIRPHIEQRLGPIDVAIVAGAQAVRTVVVDALRPDMIARKRGAIIEISRDLAAEPALSKGVRHYAIDATQPDDRIAALAMQLASDTAPPP